MRTLLLGTPVLLKVRFHGRGGQGVKTSCRILGRAAFLTGYVAQDSPIYGAERRGAPVAGFTRIADQPILERGYIFDPHILIVMDETLLEDWMAKPLEGLVDGGIVFINTSHHQHIPETNNHYIVVEHNLTDEALDIIGKPVISAPAAAAAAKLTGVIEKQALLEATAEELYEIGLDDETIQKNLHVVSNVFEKVPTVPHRFNEAPAARRQVISLTVGKVVLHEISNIGNAYLRRTGNWRIFRPVVDYEKCTGCMICFIYCPDSVISLDEANKPVIDYDNCKGCMICMVECPLRAISAVREGKIVA
ncbi:MAG: 2-oxoacid:acceptor oxidoreductase family protein [Candidatus Caldarchaeum sp.]|nr:2-oxoacid:acceptor oxidoreductase family protein [Candidatus Caldarchaeum sp.]